MIAPRYLPAACALIAIAIVPTLIHSYAGSVAIDGRTAAALPATLDGFASAESGRNATWGKRRFDSDDWIERDYRKGSESVRLTVVRSYDPKTLYHHPELAIAYGTPFAGVSVQRSPHHPDVPVFVLSPLGTERAAGLYVLHYGDGFVDDPIRFQIRTAGALLFSPRQAMTIFFALEANAPPDASWDRLAAANVLFAAVEQFAGQRASAAADR